MKKLNAIGLLASVMLLVGAAIGAVSCTEQERARGWGGSTSMQLDKGRKLVNVTWKGTDMWVLTRKMHDGEQAETYEFKESSSWGMMEGSVTIVETR